MDAFSPLTPSAGFKDVCKKTQDSTEGRTEQRLKTHTPNAPLHVQWDDEQADDHELGGHGSIDTKLCASKTNRDNDTLRRSTTFHNIGQDALFSTSAEDTSTHFFDDKTDNKGHDEEFSPTTENKNQQNFKTSIESNQNNFGRMHLKNSSLIRKQEIETFNQEGYERHKGKIKIEANIKPKNQVLVSKARKGLIQRFKTITDKRDSGKTMHNQVPIESEVKIVPGNCSKKTIATDQGQMRFISRPDASHAKRLDQMASGKVFLPSACLKTTQAYRNKTNHTTDSSPRDGMEIPKDEVQPRTRQNTLSNFYFKRDPQQRIIDTKGNEEKIYSNHFSHNNGNDDKKNKKIKIQEQQDNVFKKKLMVSDKSEFDESKACGDGNSFKTQGNEWHGDKNSYEAIFPNKLKDSSELIANTSMSETGLPILHRYLSTPSQFAGVSTQFSRMQNKSVILNKRNITKRKTLLSKDTDRTLSFPKLRENTNLLRRKRHFMHKKSPLHTKNSKQVSEQRKIDLDPETHREVCKLVSPVSRLEMDSNKDEIMDWQFVKAEVRQLSNFQYWLNDQITHIKAEMESLVDVIETVSHLGLPKNINSDGEEQTKDKSIHYQSHIKSNIRGISKSQNNVVSTASVFSLSSLHSVTNQVTFSRGSAFDAERRRLHRITTVTSRYKARSTPGDQLCARVTLICLAGLLLVKLLTSWATAW